MTNEITTEIQNIITAKRATLPKGGRKQYPVAKHQISTLTNLGIIDMMPEGFGFTDAETVITAAKSGKRYDGAFNAYGEGEEWSVEATALFKLLNPAPIVEVVEIEVTIIAEENPLDAIVAAEAAMYEDETEYIEYASTDEIGEFDKQKYIAVRDALVRGKAMLKRGWRVVFNPRSAYETTLQFEIDTARANGAVYVKTQWSGYLATMPTERVIAVYAPE